MAAYVEQARQYYGVIDSVDPVAKPLLAYYFVLNLTKAFLTVKDPTITAGKLKHGASDASVIGQRYQFTQEKLRIEAPGVLQELAKRTGQGFCWKQGTELQLSRLAAYLVEGADLYSDALGKKPKLLPVESSEILITGKGSSREAWLRVEVSRLQLQEQSLSARALLANSAVFGSKFRHVHDDANPRTASYESVVTIAFARTPQLLPHLREEFDRSLILRDRTRRAGTDYIVLSSRPNLLSIEALSFVTIHHLSNAVRYRPQQVSALRGGKYWWLFTSWIDRACENFLLSLASRIALDEHLIE